MYILIVIVALGQTDTENSICGLINIAAVV